MKSIITAAAISMALSTTVVAQSSIVRAPRTQVLETYTAYISRDDLFNSSGGRLTKPWQIIRQDRANFHAFGIRDRDDEADSFFADPANRAIMENMLANGSMTGDAARMIIRGDILIQVDIIGRGSIGQWIDVTVLD